MRTNATEVLRLWLPFAVLVLAGASTAHGAEKSPPYLGSIANVLPEPWQADCNRFFRECRLFNRDLKRQVLSVSALTSDINSPEPYVLKVRIDIPFTGEPYDVGEVAVEYASVRLTAFKADGCHPDSVPSGHNRCGQFYFRIPDRFPIQPFLVSIDRFIARPHVGNAVIPVPLLTYRFAIDTAPPIGSMVDAARKGDVAEVRRLIAAGVNIYETHILGPDARVDRTPMLIAAALGKVEVVKALLDAGYDVNWQPKQVNSSLLIEAVRNKAPVEIIRLLIEAGAKTDALYWENGVSYTALGFVTGHPDFAVLIPMLVAHGADINRVNDFGSTLFVSRRHSLEAVAKVLENNGGRMLPPILKCPPTSVLMHADTTEGFEQWCERKGSNGVVRHGGYALYGPNAKPRLFATYEDDILISKDTFRADEKRLLTERFYPDGSLWSRMDYRENGSPLRMDIYDKTGEPLRSLFYERGYDVSRTVHYKDGKEVPER
jgi:hypothetical protein